MFFGGGFGVGLTVADLTPPEGGPPITASPSLGEVLPVHARTAEEKALELQRVQQLEQSSLPTRSSWWPPSPPTGRRPWRRARPAHPARRQPQLLLHRRHRRPAGRGHAARTPAGRPARLP